MPGLRRPPVGAQRGPAYVRAMPPVDLHSGAPRPRRVRRRQPAILAVVVLVALGASVGRNAPDDAAPPAATVTTETAPQAIGPPAAPAVVAPARAAPRGTVILIHGGGWTGHDVRARDHLVEEPGEQLVARGWRIVSIDYEEERPGLRDVLRVVDAELARRTARGPLCLYGESAGGHLALLAAAHRRRVGCVIALGAPTDLVRYQATAAASKNPDVRKLADRMAGLFGTTAAELRRWNPVALAPAMRADVLLLHEDADPLITMSQVTRFQRVRPTTQARELEAADPADADAMLGHAPVSDRGRERYYTSMTALLTRAAADRIAERAAARTGCTDVRRPIADAASRLAVSSSLRCLARRAVPARPDASGWRQTTLTMRGELNAARIWAYLRETHRGRQALVALARGGATVSARRGQRSRVIVRAAGW